MKELPLIEISEILSQWVNESGVKPEELLFTFEYNTLNIYTSKPGLLIGKSGAICEKYKNIFNQRIDYHNSVIEYINKTKGYPYELNKIPHISVHILRTYSINNFKV